MYYASIIIKKGKWELCSLFQLLFSCKGISPSLDQFKKQLPFPLDVMVGQKYAILIFSSEACAESIRKEYEKKKKKKIRWYHKKLT